MELILWRHAEAEPHKSDELSDQLRVLPSTKREARPRWACTEVASPEDAGGSRPASPSYAITVPVQLFDL